MLFRSTQAIKEACRQTALNNCGYLDVGEGSQRQQVLERYRGHDEVEGGLKTIHIKNQPSNDDYRAVFESLAEESSHIHYDPENPDVCFFDPFEHKGFEGEETLQTELAEAFRDQPIRTREQLRSALSTDIPDGDFDLLARTLQQHGYVEKGFTDGGTSYYKAGNSLTSGEQIDEIPSLVDKLVEEADDNGEIGNSDLRDILGIAPVDASIVEELERMGDLYVLEESYLVADEECVRRHARNLADQGLVDGVRQEFRDADYILSRDRFDRVLEQLVNEASGVLSTDVDREVVLEAVEEAVTNQVHLYEDRFNERETGSYLIQEEKVKDFVSTKAESAIRTTANGTVPTDERTFIERVGAHVDNMKFNGRGGETSHYQKLIKDEVESIAKRGELRQIAGGE